MSEPPQMLPAAAWRREAARLAVQSAAEFRDPGLSPQQDARGWADFWFAWLAARPTTTLHSNLVVKDTTGHTRTQIITDGGDMSQPVQMTMDDTADYAGSTTDDHNDPTSDTLSITADDNGAVLALTVTGNAFHAVPVAEGTSNITVSDPAAPQVAPQVFNVTVGPGPTSQIQGTITVNTGANAVPPPAG